MPSLGDSTECTASNVLGVGYGLEMIRANARTIATEVVEFESAWDRAVCFSPREDVGGSQSGFRTESAIAVLVLASGP